MISECVCVCGGGGGGGGGGGRMGQGGVAGASLAYLLYAFGNTSLSNQYRPRSDATERGV